MMRSRSWSLKAWQRAFRATTLALMSFPPLDGFREGQRFFLGLRQAGFLAEIDIEDALTALGDAIGRDVDLAQVLLGLPEVCLQPVDAIAEPAHVLHQQADRLLDLA